MCVCVCVFVCVCVCVCQSEEKVSRLQASLTDAEDKLSSKFPAALSSAMTVAADGSTVQSQVLALNECGNRKCYSVTDFCVHELCCRSSGMGMFLCSVKLVRCQLASSPCQRVEWLTPVTVRSADDHLRLLPRYINSSFLMQTLCVWKLMKVCICHRSVQFDSSVG